MKLEKSNPCVKCSKLIVSISLLFIFAFIIPINSFSQIKKKALNLPNYDKKNFHFGYTVGFNTMDFNIRNSDDFFKMTNDSTFQNNVLTIENKRSPGFHLGIVSDYQLSKYFDFRALLNLSFGQRNLRYLYIPDSVGSRHAVQHDMKIESVLLEIPLLIKFKSQRINNYRIYTIAGILPRADLASQKKIKEEELPMIRLNRYDVAYEVGAGIDLYLPYFKFSVELKYDAGITNLVNYDDTNFSKAIKHLNSRSFMISLHFE